MSQEEYASAAALAGLATELDTLKRQVEPLEPIPARLETLADRIEALNMELQASMSDQEGQLVSWMTMPADPAAVYQVLTGLVRWLDQVWMRYPDGAAALGNCWLWHPSVIEELLWCQRVWTEAYTGKKASPQAVGDWHDRYRPGVVRRVKDTLQSCSLEEHSRPRPPATAPVTNAANLITTWWAQHRSEPAPVPEEQHYQAAHQPASVGHARR